MAVTIDGLKEYLRIDHFDDDFLLADLLTAANAYITGLCLEVADGENTPAPVEMAVKIMAAHLYENRLPTGEKYTGELPFSVSALIAPYRDWEEAVDA